MTGVIGGGSVRISSNAGRPGPFGATGGTGRMRNSGGGDCWACGRAPTMASRRCQKPE